MLTEQNLISILLLGLVLVMVAYGLIFDKLKKTYQEHLKFSEDENKQLKHSFNSLLTAKKNQHKELKELKVDNSKKAKENMVNGFEYDNVVASLENCRIILELIGKAGTLQQDFYISWCKKSYEMVITNFIQATLEIINEAVTGKTLDILSTDDKVNVKRNKVLVEKMRITLNDISFKLINKTEIIQDLVNEMFYMVDDFYKEREKYFISSGPVPRAQLSQEILTGDSFKPILRKLLEEENLTEVQFKVIEFHLTNILLAPLITMRESINRNSLDKLLSDTGYVVLDVTHKEMGFAVSFVIPALPRKNLSEKSKDFSKTFLNFMD